MPPELCLIVIHPAYQRRGAGKQLLEHFCNEADYLKLPVFCQASVEGRALYEKFGFDMWTASRFPTDGIGIPGTRLLWNMVREPRPFVPQKITLGTFENDPIKPIGDFKWPDMPPVEGEDRAGDPEPAEGESDDDQEVAITTEAADAKPKPGFLILPVIRRRH